MLFPRIAQAMALTAAVLALLPANAEGCSCVGTPDPPGALQLTRELETEVHKAFAVFIGEPIARNALTIRFRVNAVWKGDLGTEVVMSTGSKAMEDGTIMSSSCDASFLLAKVYLVFAYGENLETMAARQCSFTSELRDGGILTLLDGIAPRRHASADIAPRAFVAVVGNVRKPGLVDWQPGMTVADALQLAGGVAPRIRKELAYLVPMSLVMRTRIGASDRFPASATTALQPDDQLAVASDLVSERR